MWDEGNKEVGYRIGVTEQTVKNNLLTVFSKLGVRNRTQAIIYDLFMPEEYRARETGQAQAENAELGEGELHISDRELQMFTLRGCGLLNKQIAAEFGITEHTVKNHMTHVLKAGGFRTTIDAIAGLIGSGKIDASLLAANLDFSRYDLLTPVERKLLQTLTDSWDVNGNKGLAYEQNISMQTTKNHLSTIFSKLGVVNRFQAAVFELLRPKSEEEGKPQPFGESNDVYVAAPTDSFLPIPLPNSS